jgi:hypothetical protein
MDTAGLKQAEHVFRLFMSRPWQLLEPDSESKSVVAGRGSYGSIDYVCAARSSDASTLFAYLPLGQTISLELGRIESKTQRVRASWYDPRTGQSTAIGSFENQGRRDFTPPDRSDWVLVLDDESAQRGLPGR